MGNDARIYFLGIGMSLAFPYLSDLVRELTGLELPLPLPMFGIMVATAALISIQISRIEVQRHYEVGRIGPAIRRIKREDGEYVKEQIPPQDIVSDLITFALIIGLIGARIFHIIEHPNEFIADPLGMIFTRGGFTFLGGLICGTLAGIAYAKKYELSIPALCDCLAPAIMLGYAIGRIGCQLSGDGDWGISANIALKPDWLPIWFWAQTYDNNIVGVTISPPGVYPTSIYETIMGCLIFGILWGLRKHPFQSGWLFALYLLLSGAERFFIEQIRVNTVTNIFGVAATQAEIISSVLMLFGILGLVFKGRVT